MRIQHLEEHKFHWQICNDCVAALTFADAPNGVRTFKTFGVPGAAVGGGGEGGFAADKRAKKALEIDLGNGVTVTTRKVVSYGVAGGKTPPLVSVDMWKMRREQRKAAAEAGAAGAAASDAAATAARAEAVAAAVVGSCGVHALEAAAVAAAAAEAASCTLTEADVAACGGAVGARGVEERSSGPQRKSDASSRRGSTSRRGFWSCNWYNSAYCYAEQMSRKGGGESCQIKDYNKGEHCGERGSTAPNSPEDDFAFFPNSTSDTDSLTSSSRISSGSDIIDTEPPPKQQQGVKSSSPLGGVRAKAQALERKIAGLEAQAPGEAPGCVSSISSGEKDCGSETPVGELVSRYSAGACGRSGMGGGDVEEGTLSVYCGGVGGAGRCEERGQGDGVETGGGWGQWIFGGLAAVGVGVVGVTAWVCGSRRPSRR